MMFIMKVLAVSSILCTILTISRAVPINSTTSLDEGLCAHQKEHCSDLVGSSCPKCDANGNFLPHQCSGSTGYCWCVDIITGKEIPNTQTPPGVVPVNCMKRDCPDGWFQFGHQCFSFISSAKTWTEAQIYCQFDGGNLASIHSNEENQFVQTLTRGNTHNFPETWIGGTDAIHPDVWMWIDGSKFYYENWYSSNDHEDNSHNDENSSHHDSHDDSEDHDHDNSSHHDSHDDSEDHDHDNSRHRDSHDNSEDHDHDNSSNHDNHDNSEDHDHDNSSHHDSHDNSEDHDHDNSSNHDSHADGEDHDHDNSSHHDSHDDSEDQDHDNSSHHDSRADGEDHDHDNSSHHDSHVDTDDDDHHDHHSHNKRTSSCLRMNCNYEMKWCTAACDDAFPFVCSRKI